MVRRILANYWEDAQLDWEWLNTYFPTDQCRELVALTGRDISVIMSLLRYAHWEARWVNYSSFTDIQNYVFNLEHCLMSGCNVGDLIKTNLMLLAAITGDVVDLDADLPTGNFSVNGLTPQFIGDVGNTAQAIEALPVALSGLQIDVGTISLPSTLIDAVTAIQNAIEGIQTAVEGMNNEDLEDDLANIWQKLSDISIILGNEESEPPEPL